MHAWLTKGADVKFTGVMVGCGAAPAARVDGRKHAISQGRQAGWYCWAVGGRKVTLVASIFRIVEASAGTIEIGGIDIRSRFAAVTTGAQCHLAGAGSRRSDGALNLDPHGQHGDDALWHASIRSLGDTVRALPGMLDASVEEGGQNFGRNTPTAVRRVH